MRAFFPELRVTVTPGAFLLLALMLLILPLQWVAAWLVSIMAHESGHLLAAWFLSVRVWEFSVGFQGVRIETEPMTDAQELLCAAAGPLAGVILLMFARWIPMVAVCAFLQTIFNLIPLGNLDGGRVVRCLMGLLRKIPCKQEKERVQ